MACAAGVPVAINTDAHDIAHLRFMDIGVRYANRAWLPKDMIVNTWTREQFEAFIQRNK